MNYTRRQFLGTTAAAVIVGGMKAQGTVIGANNRIRVCTIGFNGQGGSHIKDILAMKGEAEYVAPAVGARTYRRMKRLRPK